MNKPTKPDTFSMMPEINTLPVKPALQGGESQSIEKFTELIQEKPSVWKPISVNHTSGADRLDWLSKIYNMLFNLDETAELFRYESQHKSWLNAFLLAAGMSQIVEDYLCDAGILGKATNLLRGLPQPFSSFIATLSATVFRIWVEFQGWIGEGRTAIALKNKLNVLVSDLSEIVINPSQTDIAEVDHIVKLGEDVLSSIHNLPKKLRQEIIRLPSCFLSFDQQFEDFQHIIRDFSARWPDRDRALLLIGIRTSGSYLGPLYSTLLKSIGYHNVSVITTRPGKFLSNQEWASIHQLIKANGLALICDDPPITGGTFYKTARMVEEAGLPIKNIILMMQLFGDRSSLPSNLATYQTVITPWQEWSIHQYLAPKTVEHVLTEACIDSISIAEVTQISIEHNDGPRQHVHALYHVKLIDNQSGAIIIRLVQVKGVGLGYFAEHVLAVSQALQSYSAQIITIQNGLCYLDLSTDSRLLSPITISRDDKWIESVIEYIFERNKKLRLHEDISLKLYGRNAVWEVASNLLSKIFCRGWWLARMAFLDPYVKEVLRPSKPSIIDGDIGLVNWYIDGNSDKHLMKMNLTERDFSHMDLFSYDPIFDLACLAQEVQPLNNDIPVRQLLAFLSCKNVPLERWMLYQLVRLWDINRQINSSIESISRRMAKVIQEYFSEIYFSDLAQHISGPICALDVDGVLETHQLGFAGLTKSSATSLRALIQHGYRVVLATGRSLDEVMDRCAAYHLTGGVAEYGAVLYNHASGEVMPLLTGDEQIALNRIRSVLANMPGVYVDSGHQFSVRAYTTDSAGERRDLSDETISNVLRESGTGGQVYAIKGIAQTDFMVIRIDKGVGLKEWLAHFDLTSSNERNGSGFSNLIALAVGDSRPDLAMFGIASHAFVPAHAGLKENCFKYQVTDRPYQRGFEQAVAIFLGHEPGRCTLCQMPTIQPETEFMLDILSAREDGLMYLVKQAIRLYLRKVRQAYVSPE